MRRRLLFGLGSFAFAGLLTGTVSGWAQSTPTAIEIPRNATALEGVPQVRFAYTYLSSTEPGTTHYFRAWSALCRLVNAMVFSL
jgi:hypothetical protein